MKIKYPKILNLNGLLATGLLLKEQMKASNDRFMAVIINHTLFGWIVYPSFK